MAPRPSSGNSNRDQYAPGDEAGYEAPNTPYVGYDPGQHVGLISLNQAFAEGAALGTE